MSVRIHEQFQTFGWDLGVFDQGIWLWSKFQFPFTTFHNMWWLGDHFHLSIVLIAPFYWLFENVRTILIVQAILTCVGGWPLFLLSKKITRNNLFSIAALFGYLLFFSLQWHTFSGFHEFALLPVVLGCLLLFWETKKTIYYWLCSVIMIFIKEELGFLLAVIGIWQLLTDRKRWQQSIVTIFLGISISIVLIYWIIPSLAGKSYIHFDYGKSGYTVIDVIKNIILNPSLIFVSFVDSQIKLRTLWITFWPWGFLSLLAPSTLVVHFEQFASRFLDYQKTIRWTPYFIYNFPMATIMFWSSIYGFKNIQQRINQKRVKVAVNIIIPLMLIILVVLENILLHAPILSLFKKQFYTNESWMADNKKAFLCIPKNVSLAAQNSLAPWLSQRQKIKVLPEGIGYDYIIVDLHEGQSENNFRELGRIGTINLINELIVQKQYKIICEEKDTKVLQKS